MKKLILLAAAGLMLGGAAFAKEDNGALGFGIISDSSEKGLVGGGFRGNLFFDVGYQLAGPVFYGWELQGDVKMMNQNSFTVSQTDVTSYDLGGGNWITGLTTSNYNQTYTMWDLDFSPRGYISFDLGDKLQVLGFGGLNYNWQTLDYTVKNVDWTGGFYFNNKMLYPGDESTISKSFDGTWQALAGFRVTFGAFYADYTRFLDLGGSQLSWNAYNKDRLGVGINLRF